MQPARLSYYLFLCLLLLIANMTACYFRDNMEWLDFDSSFKSSDPNFVNDVKTCSCISFEQSEKEGAQII
jgi:hypothetical protein